MATSHNNAKHYLQQLKADRNVEAITEGMLPSEEELSPRLSQASSLDPAIVDKRWQRLGADEATKDLLFDPITQERMASYEANIENFIGSVSLPIGIAGPLRVNGLFAQGDFYVPMATTEAALVASTTRGAQLISLSGGCSVAVINDGVQRSPVFSFQSMVEAGKFINWVSQQYPQFCKIASQHTNHGELKDMRINMEGNHVYLILDFHTADAAGQNMVTFLSEHICHDILEHCPIKPTYWFLESNMSGDKKSSMQSFMNVRGCKVIADVTIPAKLVKRRLHCEVIDMVRYWRCSALGGVMSGTIGVQGHYANGLAALYIALGQDPACVAESAIGVTRMEETDEGDLYVTVSLPNIIMGTVGGGTSLPEQSAALSLLNLPEENSAAALCEICAATLLAGEISIIGALSASEFASAHFNLARSRKKD